MTYEEAQDYANYLKDKENQSTSPGMKAANAYTTTEGSQGQKASSALSAAGMASGNPYLMAAGLGLGVVADRKQKEAAHRQQAVELELGRRNRVMELMANLGQGIGGIG